jgi:uncharacterized protein YndB with AHSA1/START domain
MASYSIQKETKIIAHPTKVWEALTTPDIIAQYLFGTEVVTDWLPGSEIIFQGEYQGTTYRDKGKILANEKGQKLQYSYWSGFSGLPDRQENYSIVTYVLEDQLGLTILTLTQDNIASKEAAEHSEQNWGMVLDKIREILESD